MKKAVLLLILVSTCSLASSQKMVLFEKFTNAYCGVCPDASIQIKDIVDENPNVIWISHHKPVTFTENPLNNPQSIALWDDLNILGVPNGMVDRTLHNNNISISRSLWKEQIEDRLTEPETFGISISDVSYDIGTRNLQFEVTARAKNNALPGSYRITAYIVEDSVIYRQHSYFNNEAGHPLEGLGDILWGHKHLNVVRDILGDHWGTTDIIPNDPVADTPYSHTYNYTIPEGHFAHNTKIVAMISLHDEVINYPGEIQNATRVVLKELDIAVSNTHEQLITPSFTLSPNPTTNFIEITFQKLPEKVIITDTQGKIKTQANITELKNSFDIQSYQPGIYFLMAEIDGQWIAKEFIVSK